jgi:hypothetical protein
VRSVIVGLLQLLSRFKDEVISGPGFEVKVLLLETKHTIITNLNFVCFNNLTLAVQLRLQFHHVYVTIHTSVFYYCVLCTYLKLLLSTYHSWFFNHPHFISSEIL